MVAWRCETGGGGAGKYLKVGVIEDTENRQVRERERESRPGLRERSKRHDGSADTVSRS